MSTITLFKGRCTRLFPISFPITQRGKVAVNALQRISLLIIFVLLCAINLSAQQLHTDSNAVSIDNETNSTSGWTGGSTITADTSDPYHGTYAMKVVSTTANTQDRRAEYTFPATIGEVYDISIWAKVGAQTVDPAFASWVGFSGFSTTLITGATWTEYTFSLTATSSNPVIIVFTGTQTNGSVGDEVYIDHVSILLHDDQNPTTPSLTTTSKTENSVSLSWSGSTDNLGIIGYNIYKDGNLEASPSVSPYTVTGLSASTTYSFTITALDAAGNESTPSTTLQVTTDAASGGGSSVWSEVGSVASYSGNVAIGTSSVPTGYKLAVDGHIRTREIRVDQDTWPDYVFDKTYDLPTLDEIKKHIEEKGHLPNIPSAKQVLIDGIELGQMDRLLLEKIEQLTLYILQQQVEIDQLKGMFINQTQTEN